jgi:FlaA1/EpsC-like NDP-sugar epimerase
MEKFRLKVLFAKWIGKLPYLPVYLVFLIDFSFMLFCMIYFYFLLESVAPTYMSLDDSILWSSFMLGFLTILMIWKKTYRGIVRFSDVYEIINFGFVFAVSIFLFLVIYLSDVLFEFDLALPKSFIFLSHVGSFVFLILYRLTIKEIFFRIQKTKSKSINIIIFGGGQGGRMVFQMLNRELDSRFNVSGFFDDDKSKTGKLLYGIKILSGDTNLEKYFSEKNIVELIVAAKELTNRRKKELFDLCYKHNVKVRFLPALETYENKNLELRDLRNIKLEELLGRDTIELDQNHLVDSFEGKVVLVTGAGGSIGSELCRQISQYPIAKLVLLDMAESALYDINQELLRKNLTFFVEPVLVDIRNKASVNKIFAKYKPNLVFHAAAYKHVPLMESFPKLAIEVNILGTKNIADASVDFMVEKFILISTDKAVNPTNVMGASKRMAEIYIQSRFYCTTSPSPTQFITTRFGNVLGSNGSVIPLFMKQIESGGPVTVTHKEIERFFMTIPEACRLVMEAGSMGNGGEIYVFDMGDSVKIYDLAEKMITLTGKIPNKDIHIEITGLRSGEKLYEELIGVSEKFKSTHHPKIHIVQSFPLDFPVINSVIIELQLGLLNNSSEDILIGRIKQIIPEFISSYSRFTILDN